MFERLSRGWDLAMESCQILRKDKQLLVFPILSGISSLLVMGSFIAPLWATGYIERIAQRQEQWQSPLAWVILFAYYAVNYFVIVFFNSALVACALTRFRGGEPTVNDGLRVAVSRLPVIVAWALVSATVGVVLKLGESYSKKGSEFLSAIMGVVWSVATFFIVPVLVIENLGPIDAVKRSAKMIADTWGESFVADLGIGLVSFLAAIPGFALCIFGGMLIARGNAPVGAALLLPGILALILVSLISSVLEIIARTGLYLQAADEKVIRKFERQLLGE